MLNQIDAGSGVVYKKHLLPGSPSIGGPVDPPVVVGRKQVSAGSRKNPFFVLMVNNDAPDIGRFIQPCMCPGVTAVGRFINSVSPETLA